MSADVHYPQFSFPPYFEIETVRGCNTRCPFCPIGTGQINEFGLMDAFIFDKLADEIIQHRDEVKRVTLCVYGEPLLDPRLEERIKYFKQANIAEVVATTNAGLLTSERARSILESGIDILRISISTVNPKLYPRYRPGLQLTNVLANAEGYFRLRDEINPKSRIYISMERHDDVTEIDVENWKKHWTPFLKEHDTLKVTICYDRIVEERSNLGNDRVRKPCHSIFQTLDISYAGEGLLCSADYKSKESPYRLGNILENSIAQIWNGERARHYRELHAAGRRNEIHMCRGCDLWSTELKENIAGRDLLP